MPIIRTINKTIVFVYCFLRFFSFKMAFSLAFHNAGLKRIGGIARKGKKIVFNSTGNSIYISQLPVFEFSTHTLIDLLQNPKVTVEASFPEKFEVTIEGLRFNVNSLSNMAVLYEVFIERIYEVDLIPQNLLVIDIGMNVGVASHYFAMHEQVKAVYGYEPFAETYLEALDNLALNSSVSHKIFCHNYGVSNLSETRELSLFDSGLLSASTMKNPSNEYGRNPGKTIRVQLRSITEIFDSVFPQYPDSPVLLKIDCEGEEYAIFEKLKGTQYLDKIICVLIEWHEKGAEPISGLLKDHGFQMLHLPHPTANCGMIYGFRN